MSRNGSGWGFSGDGLAGRDPGGKSAIEERYVVAETGLVEREDQARGSGESIGIGEVDDNPAVVGHTEGFELGAQRFDARQFERKVLGIAFISGPGEIRGRNSSGPGDVACR